MSHGPQTARVVLTPEEHAALTRWARRRSTAQALALRDGGRVAHALRRAVLGRLA